MVTNLQKATIQSIVNIFETGSVRGNYALVVVLQGDSGGLTYGRSQTTLMSGNLFRLVDDYCGAQDARYASQLKPYLSRLEKRDWSLNQSQNLKELLRLAGSDPVMRSIQDGFFDRVYWAVAVREAKALGITSPLGLAVVYDSTIHGSFRKIAQRTTAQIGTVAVAGERKWIQAYITKRRSWLMALSALLAKTVYRMDAFQALVKAGNWDLDLPLSVRGLTISEETMGIESNPEAPPWHLFLNEKDLGRTVQNEADQYRNYFPVRALYSALMGEESVKTNLGFADGKLTWKGQVLAVPHVVIEGVVWVQVRGIAGILGLNAEREPEKKRITLTRVGN